MNNSLTYILGAGASSQAMPLVSNFNSRFELFIEYLNKVDFVNETISNDIYSFKESIKAHLSFDTYFKKLFHWGDKRMILKHKIVLLLYFLFEQLVDEETLRTNNLHLDLKQTNYNKSQSLDPRYEALIAGLLKPISGGREFYTKINFLTWNYDDNLLFALRNFINPDQRFTEFVNRRFSEGVINVTEQVKVYHLNGLIKHETLNHFRTENPLKKFNELFTSFEDNIPSLEEAAESIKFAWEHDITYYTKFEKPIQESSNIIMIGYSLPLYNRLVDSIILKKSSLRGKNVYIQNLYPQVIADILESDFGINSSNRSATKEDPKIVLSDNCNSFIVPNSIISH